MHLPQNGIPLALTTTAISANGGALLRTSSRSPGARSQRPPGLGDNLLHAPPLVDRRAPEAPHTHRSTQSHNQYLVISFQNQQRENSKNKKIIIINTCIYIYICICISLQFVLHPSEAARLPPESQKDPKRAPSQKPRKHPKTRTPIYLSTLQKVRTSSSSSEIGSLLTTCRGK